MVALDATSTGTATTAVSSLTWSHTCTGNDRLLVVGPMARDLASPPDCVVTGVTYNSVALTKIRHEESTNQGSRVELWYLIAPTTGANDIVITWTAAVSDLAAGGAISLTGVHQTVPNDANNGDNDPAPTSTTATCDVTTIADNAWVIDVLFTGDGVVDVLVAGAGQTEFAIQENVGVFAESVGMSYEGPKTPAGAVTASWTWTTVNRYCHAAASVNPTVSGPPKMGRRMYVLP